MIIGRRQRKVIQRKAIERQTGTERAGQVV